MLAVGYTWVLLWATLTCVGYTCVGYTCVLWATLTCVGYTNMCGLH
jgi:hypothetical protein